MNLLKACQILELPENYTDVLLKKNYRSLAMKYHPDKNKETDANEKFSEINTAHEFLSKKVESNVNNNVNVDNIFNNIFKSFNSFNLPQKIYKPQHKKEVFIHLTPKEYFEGTVKPVNIKEKCICEHNICMHCAGCGFNLNVYSQPLDICMNCVGDGYTQNCLNCENGIVNKNINITIAPNINTFEIFHPMVGLIKLSIDEPYFLKEKMYCHFNISLKESLTGFNKNFKDPFGNFHNINVKGIVKSNDGYALHKLSLVLVFNVIYPEKLNAEIIEQLKCLDF